MAPAIQSGMITLQTIPDRQSTNAQTKINIIFISHAFVKAYDLHLGFVVDQYKRHEVHNRLRQRHTLAFELDKFFQIDNQLQHKLKLINLE